MLVGFPLGERLSVRIPPLRPCWQGRGGQQAASRMERKGHGRRSWMHVLVPALDARGTSPADAVLFTFTVVDKCQQPQSEARNYEVFHAHG